MISPCKHFACGSHVDLYTCDVFLIKYSWRILILGQISNEEAFFGIEITKWKTLEPYDLLQGSKMLYYMGQIYFTIIDG